MGDALGGEPLHSEGVADVEGPCAVRRTQTFGGCHMLVGTIDQCQQGAVPGERIDHGLADAAGCTGDDDYFAREVKGIGKIGLAHAIPPASCGRGQRPGLLVGGYATQRPACRQVCLLLLQTKDRERRGAILAN